MGFPSARDFSSTFGVTDEDHDKWEQRRAKDEAARQSGGLRQAIDAGLKQSIGLGKMMVQAKKYGREERINEEQEREEVTVTETRTRKKTRFLDEEPEQKQADDGPEF